MSQLPVKFRILASNVPLYPAEDAGRVPTCFLTDSDEGEIIAAANGFVRFKHLDGRAGFTRGDVWMYRIQEMTVNPRNIPLYHEATSKSPVVCVVRRTELRIRGIVTDKKGQKWADVATDRGGAGFLPGYALGLMPGNKKRRNPPPGQMAMILGAITFGIGVLVTGGSLFLRGQNGIVVIAWGSVFFGAVRFVDGLRIYQSHRRLASRKKT